MNDLVKNGLFRNGICLSKKIDTTSSLCAHQRIKGEADYDENNLTNLTVPYLKVRKARTTVRQLANEFYKKLLKNKIIDSITGK
ncbi:hypothetical protein [Carnobacterium sp. ISL-102]|uniref:hypothetical protein n=1 Tax=Carnobacterium sp. ISL-102 TaxID=2819142 RepID=UPI001BE4EFA7|nr:hypothetical protein [Carnobacterium sp. ISL-102]MBT2731136.1 hypothetical protein [Carnobacterium sp. ISL-102]